MTVAPLLAALALAASPASAFIDTDAYAKRQVRGFEVLISPVVREHPGQEAAALKFLDRKLGEIVRLLPKVAVSQLREVRVWVEWAQSDQGSTYHPSAEWLTAHGYNPDKERSVELSTLRHVLEWGDREQPMIMLHEFAHAYHHILGYDNQDILDAYHHALDSKLYESVPYANGGKKRAYALTNEKEYFAELTESYFGKNDFYPFTRADLKSYDPVGYALMVGIWGPPKSDPPRLTK